MIVANTTGVSSCNRADVTGCVSQRGSNGEEKTEKLPPCRCRRERPSKVECGGGKKRRDGRTARSRERNSASASRSGVPGGFV